MDAAEILRAEAMKIGVEVLARTPIRAADQALIPPGPPNPNEYEQFKDAVLQRFVNRPDGAGEWPHSTHARLIDLVQLYLDGRCPRSRLHAKVCVLFIGHADLFNRFENLRLMHDGRNETRHQIMQWRNDVRIAVMTEIYDVLTDCWSAIYWLKNNPMPETLNSRIQDFIEATRFPAGVDPNDQFHRHVMENLVTDPTRVRDHVLPSLEMKQNWFRELDHFLTHYFGLVASGGLI